MTIIYVLTSLLCVAYLCRWSYQKGKKTSFTRGSDLCLAVLYDSAKKQDQEEAFKAILLQAEQTLDSELKSKGDKHV